MTIFSLIGTIDSPLTGEYADVSGATILLSAVIRLLTIAAGVYAMVNFVIAGIGFIGSAGNPEAVQRAWSKITQSLIGLSVVVLAIAIGGIIGQIFFGDATYILDPTFTGP